MIKEPHEYWDDHCQQMRDKTMSNLPETFRKLIDTDREARDAFEYVGRDMFFHWNKTDLDTQLEWVFKALMAHDCDLFLDYPKAALLQFRDELERETYEAGRQD